MEEVLKHHEYDNNGWAKHQLMVLAQLEGHTLMLKDLIKEIAEIKQEIAVSAVDAKNWRTNVDNKISSIQNDLDYIWNDDKGIDYRVKMLEDTLKIEKQSTLKFKGSWALIGGVGVIVIDIVMKALEFLIHKP